MQTLKSHISFNLFNIISIVFLTILLFGLGLYTNTILYVSAGVVGLIVSYFLFANDKLWLYFALALTPFFISTADQGLSITDVIAAFIFNLMIFVWFIKALFFRKIKIINDFSDFAIIFFFFIAIVNVVAAILNDVEFVDWLKAYLLFSIILLYIPLKTEFGSKEESLKLLKFAGLLLFVYSIIQFTVYYRNMMDVKYVYEWGGAVRHFLYVISLGFGFAFAFSFYQNNKKYKALIILLTLISLLALITSFARTFWITSLITIGIVFIFLEFKQKINVFLSTIFLLILTYIGILVLFSNLSDTIFKFLETRIYTFTEGKKDISAKGRLAEWTQVTFEISQFPMFGNGLNKKFKYYDPIMKTSTSYAFVHNGYLYLIHKFGILMPIIFLLGLFIKMTSALLGALQFKDKYYKILSIIVFATFVHIFLDNLTNSQFALRDGIIGMMFLLYFSSVVDNGRRELILNVN